jgi:pseudaminic acid synthase
MQINDRKLGKGHPSYIIAEMSANHNHDYDAAIKLIEKAKWAGADAIKLQTYTPDTMTIDCDNNDFVIKGGSPWDGRKLYELYNDAYTPWEWQAKLMDHAAKIGLDAFSTPFDKTAVDFLEDLNVPAYKVASFEIVDLPLLKYIARLDKPIILSTGMCNINEIDEAMGAIREAGNAQVALLKCTSDYPASVDDMNLRAIQRLMERYEVPVGLSDHTLTTEIPVAAVSLGACIVEKHLTLDRNVVGPDSKFSMEPSEFKEMVKGIRNVGRALGEPVFNCTESEEKNKVFRRSLYVVEDVKKGELFTDHNIRSIRPGYGLHTRYLSDVIGKMSKVDIKKGTQLSKKHYCDD